MYVKTIEVPDTMVSVTTDENYKYYWIRNLGEKFVGVFKNSSGTGFQGFHAVVGPRECVKVIPEGTTLYFASANEGTTNKIEIYGTNTADCPFEGKAKGGDGGGTLGIEEVVLWENDGTTNPQTITLSEAWSDFDELVIVTDWIENNTHIWGYTTIQNTYNIGDIVRLWYYDNTVYGSYAVTSATILTRYAGDGSNWIGKIIGRCYTRVSPTGYREIELYSNDEHAATPIDTVLTLSQNWADFDAIGFISEFNEEVGLCAYNEWKVSVISATNRITLNFDVGSGQNSFIYLTKASSSSFVVNGLNTGGVPSHVYKIIGIKY